MLRTRLLTAIVLIPIVIWLVYLGGLPFLALVAGLTALAEIEFCLLIARRFRPSHLFGVALVWLFLLDARLTEGGVLRPGLVAVLCISLIWQIVRHRHLKTTDWTGVITSGLYLGAYGSCLIKLRQLPGDGLWWTLIAIPAILFADSGAYFVGSAWGQHKLAPSLSPGKTWEGYGGGILVGSLTAAALAWLWGFRTDPGSAITAHQGLLLGALISGLAPIGDLTVSIVKREAGVDNSGKLLPGHGGVLDRLDSVLWAAAIGYYYIVWLVK